jgi:hypothetical protein
MRPHVDHNRNCGIDQHLGVVRPQDRRKGEFGDRAWPKDEGNASSDPASARSTSRFSVAHFREPQLDKLAFRREEGTNNAKPEHQGREDIPEGA